MAYGLKTEFVIKTFQNLTEDEALEIIKKALWNDPRIRDVQLVDYETDLPKEHNSFADIRPQVIETTRPISEQSSASVD